MKNNKGMVFPLIITILVIVIIIYLFVTIEQPYVECSKSTTDDLNIKVTEKLTATLDSNKLKKMELTKTIILPQDYLKTDDYLESVKFSLEKSYEYLGKDEVEVFKYDDRIIAKVTIDDDETVILNNIEFFEDDDLQIKINSNTKSSDVVTLKIGDSYTEGELMVRMKNNGYVCK